jgi:hypothetical protein
MGPLVLDDLNVVEEAIRANQREDNGSDPTKNE